MLPLQFASEIKKETSASNPNTSEQVTWKGRAFFRHKQEFLSDQSRQKLRFFFKEHPDLTAVMAKIEDIVILDQFFRGEGKIPPNFKTVYVENGFDGKIPENIANLLRHGIKIKSPADVSKGLLVTALAQMKKWGNEIYYLNIIKLVLKTGSFNPGTELYNLIVAIDEDPTLFDLIDPLLQSPLINTETTLNGFTLLHIACDCNNLHFVNRILDLWKGKIDIDRKVERNCTEKEFVGLTPIQIAERRARLLKKDGDEDLYSKSIIFALKRIKLINPNSLTITI